MNDQHIELIEKGLPKGKPRRSKEIDEDSDYYTNGREEESRHLIYSPDKSVKEVLNSGIFDNQRFKEVVP